MAERWGASLRSRSPSPARSMDFSRSAGYHKGSNVFRKSVPPLGQMKKSMPVSITGKSYKSSGDLNTIEAEYIKNLQQQIYFLELEANYLRDQANKANEKQPKMTAEAERMLAKLKLMEKQMYEMQQELKRRNTIIELSLQEKDSLNSKLKEQSENHAKEKRLWTEEIVELKKVKDRLEMEMVRKDTQLLEAKSEIDKSAVALSNAEVRINTLKKQLCDAVDQLQDTQRDMEDRLSLIDVEKRELEKRYSVSNVSMEEKDRENQTLKDELSDLRIRLKEMELELEKKLMLQERAEEEKRRLERENARLNEQIQEYVEQLETDGYQQEIETGMSTSLSSDYPSAYMYLSQTDFSQPEESQYMLSNHNSSEPTVAGDAASDDADQKSEYESVQLSDERRSEVVQVDIKPRNNNGTEEEIERKSPERKPSDRKQREQRPSPPDRKAYEYKRAEHKVHTNRIYNPRPPDRKPQEKKTTTTSDYTPPERKASDYSHFDRNGQNYANQETKSAGFRAVFSRPAPRRPPSAQAPDHKPFTESRLTDQPPLGPRRQSSTNTRDVVDRLRQYQVELNHLKCQKEMEQQKAQCYLEEMTKHELARNTAEAQLSSAKLRIAELESSLCASETDNGQLRKDKMLLVDHVADLQAKIEERDREILKLQHCLHETQTKLKSIDYQADVEQSIQSQKWEEFGRLAESMRTLSNSMAAQTTVRGVNVLPC